MDLVDGHVNVFVVFVVVAGGDVVVLRKPQGVDEAFHNMPELLPVEASIFWMKRDDEMIGPVVGCPRILRLDGFDQSAGELDVVGAGYAGKVGGEEPCGSNVMAPAADVAGELDKALARLRRALVSDNHRSPANRSTARLTARTVSRSSRFSL
jgi:hypothetical protein